MVGPVIYFVIPCYNEEECLKSSYGDLNEKYWSLVNAKKINHKSKIVFVDDGSRDRTWQLIADLAKNKNVIGIKLAHNVGHQNALYAGLMYAAGLADATISMDADMQDNLSVVDGFLKKYGEGNEIIYGVRKDRKTDSFFKRWTAQLFYRVMVFLGVDLIYNAADCRLMSQRAIKELGNYKEVNLFLRGIVPLIGLKSTTVEYKRDKRVAGKSKYSIRKMLGLAWDGVTSFSIKPIKMVRSVGLLFSVISIGVLIYALVVWANGQTVSGWTFTICSIWLVAGIQMVAIGMIGEYIGKIYAETKRRPRYYIEEVLSEGVKENEKKD